ncbi:MAG: phosphopentomutase [Caldiserica bacterium]|nr:MAG: phosphopentomutase [Caldisericota bacterium]
MNIKRTIVIVIDSVGVGEAEDAFQYGDWGANTLLHVLQYNKDLKLTNMEKLGLRGLLLGEKGNYIASYGRMKEQSKGKDSISGHWEMMGIILKKSFPVYPNGFSNTLIEKFKKLTGIKGILGNKPASGTEIIKELYKEHVRTKYPIVYTSADSVFQIAAHKDVIPLEELYKMCEIARKQVLINDDAVARVIARPFIGDLEKGFIRTSERKDYSLKPTGTTTMDLLKENGKEVIGIGKIHDLFAGIGLTKSIHTDNNTDGIAKTIEFIKKDFSGLLYINLVEFDSHWGHRRNYVAYGKGLKDFDNALPNIFNSMKETDVLFITADHGCDPTFKEHTDHTREFVPIIAYGKKIKKNYNLGLRSSFSDLADTITEIFKLRHLSGKSFAKEIIIE